MKIQYMSDLHLEFADMPVPEVLGDVLVLAGDIHVGTNAIPWIEQCAMKFDHVIYLLGNHEYYGQKFWKLPGEIQDSLDGNSAYVNGSEEKSIKIFDAITNVHLLDNASIKIEDVHFHGSTLWSDAHPMTQFQINDFTRIKYKYANGYGKFSAEECTLLHLAAKKWLHDAILPGEKNVVLTHFAPSFQMINQMRYTDGDLNTYWATEIIEEFAGNDIKVWISGHTHSAYDKVIAGIHSVSNCRGYIPHEPVDNFNPVAIVEV
jgi:predicted phosphodiesterase